MSTIGNDLKAAHDLLESQGNCRHILHDEKTGQYCAWGALNQVISGQPYNTSAIFDRHHEHFEALAKHLPEDFHTVWSDQARVVEYNNIHAGQPVIDLFAKAAADEGYEVQE